MRQHGSADSFPHRSESGVDWGGFDLDCKLLKSQSDGASVGDALTNPISWSGKHDVSYFNFQRRLNTFFSTAPHLVIQMKTATPKTSTEWRVRPREPWQQSSGKPAAIEPPVVICCLSVFKYTVCTPLLRFMQEHFHTLNLNFQKWGFT